MADITLNGPNLSDDSKTKLDFSKLGTDSLRRYCKQYQLNDGLSREQMIDVVQKHFDSQPPPDEVRVIKSFVHAVARRRSKAMVSKTNK